ncbi:Gfo/Idh/MocA family protein [Nonomuraea sp. NPDC050540]|uniref:Gfo/Idh/MocA family protein n=1 Tax=Nonomuraea sp. NPDC050540 TaxID=3364367 RepID=UPI0037904629
MGRAVDPGHPEHGAASLTSGGIRVLHVGCGRRAKAHLKAQLSSGQYLLAGLCDVNGVRARELAASMRLADTHAFEDPVEACTALQPELVVLAIPPQSRPELVRALVSAGCPAVLVEKPIALTPSDLADLQEIGRSTPVFVNTQYRWMPHWRKLLRYVGAGWLGELAEVRLSTRFAPFEQGEHVISLGLEIASLAGVPAPRWVLAAACGIERHGPRETPAELIAVAGLGAARMHLVHGAVAPLVRGDEDAPWNALVVHARGTEGWLDVTVNKGYTLVSGVRRLEGATEWYRDDESAQRSLYIDLAGWLRGPRTESFPTAVESASAASGFLFAAERSARTRQRVSLLTDSGPTTQ